MFSQLKRSAVALGVSSALVLSMGAAATSAQAADTIHFAKGHISQHVTGKLAPKETGDWYQFGAAAGQYVVINIAPLAGTKETANVGVLHMPDGSYDGNKGGIVYQGCLPTTGTYKLRIARNNMATQGLTAGYDAEVVILPKYASQDICGA
ncbi:hypothetical protein [Psychrobacter aestuarii]|uniref:Uncharacterized protein n=1 Tax=Psychrobacter aestuarii TaxID=556327 RepID=A0ABN0W1Z3_9GAMM|nr:hypothetical protein [Psychrobacter aestuarii]